MRVVNNTSEALSIEYNSSYGSNESVAQKTELAPGENKVIISTPDLESNNENTCREVAEYVVARRISDGKISSVEWCGEAVKLEMVDLGQYQFLISYGPEDF